MWSIGIVLVWFTTCLPQVTVTIGRSRPVRQTQDIGLVLNRMSNIEALFVEERLKTISLQRQLSELKSRLDEFVGGGSATHRIYDNKIKGYVSDIMTKSLDIIQDGLISEKQQRLRLENMSVEIKEFVMNQNAKQSHTRLERKTIQLEKRLDVLERSHLNHSRPHRKRPSKTPALPAKQGKLPIKKVKGGTKKVKGGTKKVKGGTKKVKGRTKKVKGPTKKVKGRTKKVKGPTKKVKGPKKKAKHPRKKAKRPTKTAKRSIKYPIKRQAKPDKRPLTWYRRGVDKFGNAEHSYDVFN